MTHHFEMSSLLRDLSKLPSVSSPSAKMDRPKQTKPGTETEPGTGPGTGSGTGPTGTGLREAFEAPEARNANLSLDIYVCAPICTRWLPYYGASRL